jgi:glycosidase
MLNYMRKLLAWRKSQPALVKGTTQVLKTDSPILAFIRRTEEQTILSVFNLSGSRAYFTPKDVLDEKAMKELGLRKTDAIVLEGYGSSFTGARAPQHALGAKPPSPPPPPIMKAA